MRLRQRMLRGLSPRAASGRPRPLDLAILLLAGAAVFVSAMGVYGGGGKPSVVVSAGEHEWIYPLDGERSLDVAGPLGTTVVAVADGAARILSSPCPNQTCVASGARALPGQWLACLPNKVFVRIEGIAVEGGVDAGSF